MILLLALACDPSVPGVDRYDSIALFRQEGPCPDTEVVELEDVPDLAVLTVELCINGGCIDATTDNVRRDSDDTTRHFTCYVGGNWRATWVAPVDE